VFEPLNRDPLLHTSTCAGSPLAGAAVRAAVGVASSLNLPVIADQLGREILVGLREVVTRVEPGFVCEVRGRGLVIGIECAEEHFAAEILIELLKRRVIAAHSLNSHRVVRLTPPAILLPNELDWLLVAMEESLAAVADRYGFARRPVDMAQSQGAADA
jgi:putrescine aminotransferase